MNDDVLQQIKDVIEQNLPAHVSSVLQKRLTDADAADRDVEHLRARVREQEAEIALLRADVADLWRLKQKLDDLALREEAVQRQAASLENDVLNVKLVEAEKRADTVFRLAEIVFKNPSFTRNLSGSTPVTVPTGSYVQGGSFTVNERIDPVV